MKRPVVVAVLAAFTFANAAGADPAPGSPSPASSPRRAHGKGNNAAAHVPLAPNPYFVADDSDQNVLHPAPGALERGLDRGYLEMMARPHLSKEALDVTERELGVRPGVVLSRASDLGAGMPANPYASQNGSVLVIEGTSQTVVNSGGGLVLDKQNGMFTIASQALQTLGDNFDFITIFTTFPDSSTAAFYLPLKNDITGLGECNPNTGETFGCVFDQTGGQTKLQGLVFMNSLSTWTDWDANYDGAVHAFDDFNSAVFSTLGQEVAHRWGAALRFVDPRNGNVSKKLLGRDNSHWAAWVDTDASVMDGWDWNRPSNGRFELLNEMDVYSTLDLYGMGALPVASAKPFFFIDGAKYDVQGQNAGALAQLGIGTGTAVAGDAVLASGIPSVALMKASGIDLGARGTEVDLTIQDIVDAEGNRCPDPDHTQRTFRQAVVLVTRPGQSAAQAQADADNLQIVADTWEKWWSQRTGHALTLCTNTAADCKQALVTLGGGAVDSKDPTFIERGETVTLHVKSSSLVGAATEPDIGDVVKNAKLTVSLDGGGADHATLAAAEISVGDIPAGQDVDVPVTLTVKADYPFGSSLIVVANLSADNAPTVREEYRLFPGYANIFVENFGAADDFKVNADGQDGADTAHGALVKDDVSLSCDMTPRTPEKDNTPGSAGAYITGVASELSGDTSLWSPEIDLKDTVDPELAYDFWFEGDTGDSLLVELASDGKTFKKAGEETESAHGWGLKRIKIKDVFAGKIPDKVTARFIFNGNGHLEGGIDNFRVIDPSGQAKAAALGLFGCGCSADGGNAGPQASLLAFAGLCAVRLLRRRRP